MFTTVLIATLILVGLAFVGLGINILFRRNGKFPEHEVGSNQEMKNLGITCVRHDEMKQSDPDHAGPGVTGVGTQSPLRDCGLGCSCGVEEA